MPALAENNSFDAQVFGRLADSLCDLLHLLDRANEHSEIRGFRGIGTYCPADACLVEYLCITDQAVDVWLGKEIGAGRYQQDVRTFLINRQSHYDASLFLDVFFQTFERIDERSLRQPKVIADFVNLANNFVAVLLSLADMIHDLASGHGNFRGVDTVGAIN